MMDGIGRSRPGAALGLLALLVGAAAPAAAEDWPREARKRQDRVERYLRSTKVMEIDGRTEQVNGYEWFANIPPGSTGVEGIPVVLCRLLPDLAKRLGDRDPRAPGDFVFGEPDRNDSEFGFFAEDRDRPLPLGFAWTRPSAKLPLSITVRTCAGCHVGRVRVDDEAGTTRLIHGAPNTEIRLHQLDAALTGFLHRHLDSPEKRVRFKRELLALLDEKAKESPTWFFRNAGGVDREAEAKQVAGFKAALLRPEDRIDVLVPIRVIDAVRTRGRDQLHAVAYGKANSPEIDGGPPGLIDSSGLGLAAFVGPADLFPGAAKNDVPRFVRGIISYDRKNVGRVWRLEDLPAYQGKDLSARVYDTSQDGQSNKGHDRASYKGPDGRVSWVSRDDPDDRELNDLLEYLKTL